MLEKQLPFSLEAEMGVLGSVLIDPEVIVEIAELLPAASFYRSAHRVIYEAILALYAQHEPADFVTLCDFLRAQGQLEQVGGPGYVTSLVNHVPTSGNAAAYARIIVRKAQFREAIRVAGDLAAGAYEEDEQCIRHAAERIHALNQGRTGNAIVPHTDALTRYFSELEALHTQQGKGMLSGVPTGYRKLDALLGGWRASKMYIVAGRPGDGKSALSFNFAYEAAKRGCQVLFFSIEMEENELMQRLIAMESGLDTTQLRDGRLDADEWERAHAALTRLLDFPGKIHLDTTSRNDIDAMTSKARQQQMQTGLDLVIVDYLQKAEAGERDARKLENRRLEVERVSSGLKTLARELQVPVIALAQLNRDIEGRADRKPQLSDLREAGGIEQDTDVAMFIWRDPNTPKEAKEFDVSLMIEKHRNGAKGIVPLHFVGWQTRFYPQENR